MRQRSAKRRVGWTVIDQALSSATNFGLGILVARSFSPSDFGAFALVFSCYLFLVGSSRALVSEPLLVRHSAEGDPDLAGAMARSTGTALALSLCAGLVVLVVGAALSGPARLPLIALSVALPGLLLQDAWRYAFFASGRPAAAAANDALWAVLQLSIVGLLLASGDTSVAVLVVAWGASATVCALLGCVQAGVRPRPLAARRWLVSHRDLAPRFLGEFVAVGGALQAVLWAVAFAGGAAAAGALRGGQLLVGPLTVLIAAAPAAAIPEGVRLHRRSPPTVMRMLAVLSGGLSCAAMLWGAALLLLPESVGRALLGASWPAARPLLLPLALATVAVGASTGAIVGLRVLASAARSLRVRLIVTPTTFGLAVAGVVLGGARGAAIGIAVGASIAAFAWWHSFRLAAAEESSREPRLAARAQVVGP